MTLVVLVAFATRPLSAADSGEDLASQAVDPTASLMSFNFQGIQTEGFHGAANGLPDDQTTFQFRPVIPLKVLDRPNILRMTLPYQIGGRA